MKNNMKTMVLFVLLTTIPAIYAENIIISEVYYDPDITEAGGEFVELYNPTDNDIDISGWKIATETSDNDAILSNNSIIYSNSYFLITDANWDINKDNPEWPSADHEEPITMSNTDAGVALIHQNSTVIDAVGWGDSAGITKSFLYEGTPAEDTANAQSLSRSSSNDTNNNIDDFSITAPSPVSSSGSNNSEITIEVTVTGSQLTINSISTSDDDNLTAGFQVLPYPARKRTINITANISHSAGYENINNITLVFSNTTAIMTGTQSTNTTGLFFATIELNYFDTPKDYNIEVIANNESSTESFTYLSLAAMQIDSTSLSFSAASGTSASIIGDYDMLTSDKPTLRNIGNTKINLALSATGLVSNTSTIQPSSINYNISGLTGTLSNTSQIISADIATQSLLPLGFGITIPETAVAGTYTGTAVITAESSG